jgi:hypothetical protein
MSLCILLNACFLAAFDPLSPHTSDRNRIVDIADYTFLAIYTVEVILKVRIHLT